MKVWYNPAQCFGGGVPDLELRSAGRCGGSYATEGEYSRWGHVITKILKQEMRQHMMTVPLAENKRSRDSAQAWTGGRASCHVNIHGSVARMKMSAFILKWNWKLFKVLCRHFNDEMGVYCRRDNFGRGTRVGSWVATWEAGTVPYAP